MARFMCVTDERITEKANAAARQHGLDNAGEYVRLALEHLMEKGMPVEFAGRRSRVKLGRPFTKHGGAMRK